MRTQALGGIIAVLLAGLVAGGCSDSKFQEESGQRLERIDRNVQTWAERERGRDERLKEMQRRIDKAMVDRERRRQASFEHIDELFQRRKEDWPARKQAIEDGIEHQLEGHPDNINRTFEKMFY